MGRFGRRKGKGKIILYYNLKKIITQNLKGVACGKRETKKLVTGFLFQILIWKKEMA